ncbi:MAG: Rrf2 family transcriptional regulator [Bauldia sp.]|jgi:Rrf2 family nitric oxide-sensitive transcriptional repressor
MRLTLYTDLSLRLLMFLALRPDGLATIQEAAERYRVSRNHLMKVARQLGQTGFIETVRGRGGGLRLSRPATEIGLGDVIRTTEEDFRMVECFEPGRTTCALAPACRLKGALADALGAYLSALDKYTLADLTAHGAPMKRLLGLTDPVVGP